MYHLAGHEFKTKKEIEAKIRAIVSEHEDGDLLHFADHDIVYALLEWHRYAGQKIGVGVRSIKKVTSKTWGSEGFMLIRTDGTSTDFSWRQCLYPSTNLADVKAACREAVRSQIQAFRHNYRGSLPCPITGKQYQVSDMHVDHEPPNTFAAIFDAWVKVEHLETSKLKLKKSSDNSEIIEFADPKLARGFGVFHRLNAKLRMVSPEGNYQVERDYRLSRKKFIAAAQGLTTDEAGMDEFEF